ncbi:hypothetical protein [Maricaulis sp.]|uniref:hypothetical protein n=1 Tax=Maricaulis sp. TaxID=1486257 RepID=UPI0025C219EA|nr:hypothetical protein [Maricaulis sp.]
MTRTPTDGYALTEALIACAIAAAVVAASMGGLTTSMRGSRSAASAQQAVLEANNIAARLRAGDLPARIARDYPAWQIDIGPFDRPVDPASGAVLTRARLERAGLPGSAVELVYMEAGQVRPNPP